MAEISADHRVHHAGLGLFHTAPLHAVVLGLDQDGQPFGLTESLNFIGQDHHRFLLDMRTREDPIRHSSELAQADDALARLDTNPAVAQDRQVVI